jgi:hypothetical protein
MSRFPAAFRLPAFASRSSDSRQGIGPSSRSAYRTQRIRTLTGLPRSARTSYGRGGCLLYPEDGDAHPVDSSSPAGACRFPAASPYTPLQHPISGASDNEASTKVQAIHPSGLPLACGSRMERAPLGFSPELRTPPTQEPTTHVRVGTGLEHKPGTTLTTSAGPPIRASTRNVRPRVAAKRSDYVERATTTNPAEQGKPEASRLSST